MKEAKSKPPASKITLLGVCWEIGADSVCASAGQERVHKLLQWIKQIRECDSLSPMEASKFAGKLLSVSLRSCLREIEFLLPQLQPASFLMQPSLVPTCVLCADAFVTLHGSRRPANRWLPECPQANTLSNSTNV